MSDTINKINTREELDSREPEAGKTGESERNVLLMPKRQRSQITDALQDLLRSKGPAFGTETVAPQKQTTSELREEVKKEFSEVLGFSLQSIDLNLISVNPFQTRESFDEASLTELSESIKSNGLAQPILLRRIDNKETPFELIAGERRLRATKLLGQTEILALVKDFDQKESLKLSIVENAQRESLNPIEEAHAYKILNSHFKLTQADIASVVGKSRVYISNSLRLLSLPEEIQELLKSSELSVGHAKVLLALSDIETQLYFAGICVRSGLSVRALEQRIARLSEEELEEEDQDYQLELDKIARQEKKLSGLLDIENLKLRLNSHGQKTLSITFDSEAQWKRFFSKVKS